MNILYSSTALANSSLAPALLRGSQVDKITLPGDWGVRCPDFRLQMQAMNGTNESELQLLRPLGGWLGLHTSPYHKHMVRTVDTLLTRFPYPKIMPLISHGPCAAAGDFVEMIIHRVDDKDAFNDIVTEEIESALRDGMRKTQDPDGLKRQFTRLAQLQSARNLMDYPTEGTTVAEVLVREGISVAPIFCTFGETAKDHILTVHDSDSQTYIRNQRLQHKIEAESTQQRDLKSSDRKSKMIEALDSSISTFTERVRKGESFVER